MNKDLEKMVRNTMEGFIQKLEQEGHSKYASELRGIVAMSRRRRDAIMALNSMSLTLLTHLVKYILMPRSRDHNKWHREIKGYLPGFNIRNKNPRGLPWLPIQHIKGDLNEVLSSPDFTAHMDLELEGYNDKDKVLSLLAMHKTLKSLGIELSFDSNNNLVISVDNQPL